MPIITKKDKLSISMTWSSSDDKNEVDISIQRDGDEDVTITMQSGKSSVVVGASCIKELYDFLIDRGIVEYREGFDARVADIRRRFGIEGSPESGR